MRSTNLLTYLFTYLVTLGVLLPANLVSTLTFDFVVNRLFMKVFRTHTVEIVKCCQYYLGFSLPSMMLAKRTDNFEEKFKNNCTFSKHLL